MHNTDVDAGHVAIRTVRLSVRTLISRSVTGTKTGQASTSSHVKRIKLLREDIAIDGLSNEFMLAY